LGAPSIYQPKIDCNEHFTFITTHFGVMHRFVECDFGLRCLQLEGGIPGTAVGAVEAAAERMRMGKRRVDSI
jgi:hypothetical protein